MVAYGQTTQLFSTPYLTPAEYKDAPTAVDYDNLVPGGTAAENANELLNLIARASSWMDTYCRQVIGATVDTWQTRARIGRDGMLSLHTRYFPIREVTALSFGASPDAMSTVTLDGTVWVESRRIIVPAALIAGSTALTTFPRPSTLGRTVLAQVTYINGYPNTTLTAPVAGAPTLPLANATGILPGDSLAVYDEDSGVQTVTVASTWTPTTGAATVTVSPAVTAATGTSVSALPPAVKQAAIEIVTALLKDRGAASIEMRAALQGSPGPKDGGVDHHIAMAQDILTDFRRVA